MTKIIQTICLLTAGMLWWAGTAHAAKWGPNGHPELTYDAARSAEFNVPVEVARVMALGSIAPDYFEFDNPAAHAQTPDPNPGLGAPLFPDDYKAMQRRAFKDSESWHDLYLRASIAEMKSGHRERAAFLLGYAMHNAEDFAAHRGMPNILHAGLAKHGNDPDMDPKRLAAAHEMASLELTRFRKEVGEDNWRLFRGETIQRLATGSIVPEPLTRFGADLDGWDPRSGMISATARDEGIKTVIDAKLDKYLITLYSHDVRGQMHETVRAQAENLIFGLVARQEKMLGILRSANPKFPEPPDAITFATQLEQFSELAGKYDALRPEEKRMLGELHWKQLAQEKLDSLRRERQRLVQEEQARLQQDWKRRNDSSANIPSLGRPIEAFSSTLSQVIPSLAKAQGMAERTALTADEYAALEEGRKMRLKAAKLGYLAALVDCACGEPDSLAQLNDEGKVPGVRVELNDLKAYYENEKTHLSRCETNLFQKMIASPHLVSVPSLVDWGKDYRRDHNLRASLKRFWASVEKFGAALRDALTVPIPQSSNSSPTGSNTGTRERSSSGRSDSSNIPTSWPSLEQLKGVAASGSFPR